MVMINAATGFRRIDLAKIALARWFGASTLQIFMKIRIPMAMPMVIVGLMIGSIFGLLTAVGAEMVGGSFGLGNRLAYYWSLIQMPQFFACILVLAVDRHLDLRAVLLDRQAVGQLGGLSQFLDLDGNAQAQCTQDPAQCFQRGIAALGERPIERLTAEVRLLGKGRHATLRLDHIAQGELEGRNVTGRESFLEIDGRLLRVSKNGILSLPERPAGCGHQGVLL